MVKASWTQITAGFQSEWCSRGSGLRATTCTTRGLPVASESSVFPNGDQGCAKIIRVILRGFGGLDAGWAGEEVLFERGRLGFIRDGKSLHPVGKFVMEIFDQTSDGAHGVPQ